MKAGRHQVRQHEIAHLAGYFPPGCSILEVGAGTGEQACELARRGFSVKAIDVPTSEYGRHRVFEVQDYDAVHIGGQWMEEKGWKNFVPVHLTWSCSISKCRK